MKTKIKQQCKHCKGTYGLIVDDAHHICRIYAKHGHPIAIVTTCPDCGGDGIDEAKFSKKFAAIEGMINPPGSVFDAINRTSKCQRCKGEGKI